METKHMNRYEREVSSLSFGELERLTDKDLQWIKDNADKYSTAARREQFKECGRYYGTICAYHVIYQRVGNWQVIRFIETKEKDSKKNRITFEPLRYWLDKDGNSVLECKTRQCLGSCYVDAWSVTSNLEVRRTKSAIWTLDWTSTFHKTKSLIPELRRMNFHMPYGIPYLYTKEILTDGHLEMMHRMGLKYLCNKYYRYDTNKEKYWTAIRIALRHHFPLNSKEIVNKWWDMVTMEIKCGADVNNPHFVAPDDLDEMHDKYVTRDRNRTDRYLKRIEKQTENNLYESFKQEEGDYKADKKSWLTITFSDDRFNVHVLQTIKEFKDIGQEFHNCVYGCTYWRNRDSVCVIVTNKQGKRIELAEINTSRFYVMQQFGRNNKFSEWHKEIKELLNDNMWRFKKASMQVERAAV